MFPQPVALSLTLCDHVIIEKGTEKTSIIGQFQRVRLASFPGIAAPFCVFATLAGTQGQGIIGLEIENLGTLDRVQEYSQTVNFPDRFTRIRVIFRLNQCEFLEPGAYQAILSVDGELLAQERFEVVGMS